MGRSSPTAGHSPLAELHHSSTQPLRVARPAASSCSQAASFGGMPSFKGMSRRPGSSSPARAYRSPAPLCRSRRGAGPAQSQRGGPRRPPHRTQRQRLWGSRDQRKAQQLVAALQVLAAAGAAGSTQRCLRTAAASSRGGLIKSAVGTILASAGAGTHRSAWRRRRPACAACHQRKAGTGRTRARRCGWPCWRMLGRCHA